MTADIGPMLFRLLARSGLDTGTLARAAGVPESELVTVFDGAEPSGLLLRGLAPVLGWHASDLFLIAGLRVPDDVTPAGRYPGASIVELVWSLVYVPEVGRRLHELLRAALRQAGTEPAGAPQHEPAYGKWFRPGFGATLTIGDEARAAGTMVSLSIAATKAA